MTERLTNLLNTPGVHINWIDELKKSHGWRVIHLTIAQKSFLVLDMGGSGYSLHKYDTTEETAEEEIARLLAGK